MRKQLIYLDNAATTWPKPPSVIRSVSDALRDKSGNPGRGSHKLSNAAAEVIYEARETAGDIFGADGANVVFTLNATQALNFAIKGLASSGCHILYDNYAHNAVYRPLVSLSKSGCEIEMYDASGSTEDILRDIHSRIKSNTSIIIATHQSNICSKVLPIAQIGRLCSKYGISFIVDASQSAGHLPINLERMNITSLCMPGHKGLFGPMGTGLLISRSGCEYKTIIEGGTGINSLDPDMPSDMPERFEAGTQAVASIAGLLSGMKYVRDYGIGAIHEYECMLAYHFRNSAAGMKELELHGDSTGNVISFTVKNRTPAEIGAYLASKGICTRTGYHCAPIAHKTVGTIADGTVRISFSPMNRIRDVDILMKVLGDL